MSKTIRIVIEVPDGASMSVATVDDAGSMTEVASYWYDYLSDNGRALYGAAAELERTNGPNFTLNDIADAMGKPYASVQSIHRTTGRTAKVWEKDTGGAAPIQLVWTNYDWSEEHGGWRTTYRLPDGVADEVASL